MEYTILFNSGISIEDIVSVTIKASSTEEAVELALAQNKEYCGWNYYYVS